MTSHTLANNKIIIEIISDVVCPWCWVGKRKLETALKTYPGGPIEAQVTWRPYQLRPDAPLEGVLKSPNTPSNPRVPPRLKAAGAAVGIDFTGKTDRSPNTLLSHLLLDYALEEHGWEKQNEVQEILFQSYFTDGVFPDEENLISLAGKCGMDRTKVEATLQDEKLLEKVRKEVKANYGAVHGQGVPFFILNGRPAFSGAQDPATFHRVFDLLLEDE